MKKDILSSGKADDKVVSILRTHLLWVEACPSKIHVLKSLLLVPKNVTLFGNRVTADVISEDEVTLALGGP